MNGIQHRNWQGSVEAGGEGRHLQSEQLPALQGLAEACMKMEVPHTTLSDPKGRIQSLHGWQRSEQKVFLQSRPRGTCPARPSQSKFQAVPGGITLGWAAHGSSVQMGPSSLQAAALPQAPLGQVLAHPASSTGGWMPRKSSEGQNNPQTGALREIK